MSPNLYDILELPKDATTEQVRKAYKKKALQTHPDRLPVGSTPEEKAASEEKFRMVNNAYEVLNDPKSRRAYDLHGVWPPPNPEDTMPGRPTGSRHRAHPRHYQGHHHHHQHHHNSQHMHSDPFFTPFTSFMFTDPFTLFDSIFGETQRRQHHHPHRHSHHRHHHSAPGWNENPFEAADRMQADMHNLMANFERDMFPGMAHESSSHTRLPPLSTNISITDPSPFMSGRSRWAGESSVTTVVNGVSQSVRTRWDYEGNEHVTRTYPDGREVYTINGVEQPPSPRGYRPSFSGPAEPRHLPPPPVVGVPHINSRSDFVIPPPPPQYQSHPPGYGTPCAYLFLTYA
ncbi:hypothetical protein BD779DRAFT_1439269 [Infundibulicybe gibba]|nr:hypothetical protein BD779DRAFT_1439269 [Infundibulicybe gibba]